MCQTVRTTFKFCGCRGELHTDVCPKPTPECERRTTPPSKLLLNCYCKAHSSKPFRSIHKDQRESARVQKEYLKIIAREERDTAQGKETSLAEQGSTSCPSLPPLRTSRSASPQVRPKLDAIPKYASEGSIQHSRPSYLSSEPKRLSKLRPVEKLETKEKREGSCVIM